MKKKNVKKTPAQKEKMTREKRPTVTSKPDEPLTYNADHGSDNLLLEGILKCYRQLDPNNLCDDNDYDAGNIHRTIAETERKLRGLFVAFGREVSQEEVFWWEEEMQRYKYERSQQREGQGAKAPKQ